MTHFSPQNKKYPFLPIWSSIHCSCLKRLHQTEKTVIWLEVGGLTSSRAPRLYSNHAGGENFYWLSSDLVSSLVAVVIDVRAEGECIICSRPLLHCPSVLLTYPNSRWSLKSVH